MAMIQINEEQLQDIIQREVSKIVLEKENYIKEVADKYKNLISQKVYQSLHNYQIEITD